MDVKLHEIKRKIVVNKLKFTFEKSRSLNKQKNDNKIIDQENNFKIEMIDKYKNNEISHLQLKLPVITKYCNQITSNLKQKDNESNKSQYSDFYCAISQRERSLEKISGINKKFGDLRDPLINGKIQNMTEIKKKNIGRYFSIPKFCVFEDSSKMRTFNMIKKESSKLVKGFTYNEDQNFKHKNEMQDFYCIHKINDNEHLYCLFDGHGGDYVARFLSENFVKIFLDKLEKNENNIIKSIQDSFKILDTIINKNLSEKVGSTASILYLLKENKQKYTYCGNVGDSRVVIVTKDKVKRLSYDHKSTDKNEIERMKLCGGFIINSRLLGKINLTRTIGDLELKKNGLSSIPYISKHCISDLDKYIIIASDGVWDVISDDNLLTITNSNDSNSISEMIIKESLNLGSTDNLSCITIML